MQLDLERWHVHRLSLILPEHWTKAMLIHFMITVDQENIMNICVYL